MYSGFVCANLTLRQPQHKLENSAGPKVITHTHTHTREMIENLGNKSHISVVDFIDPFSYTNIVFYVVFFSKSLVEIYVVHV